MNEIRRVDYQSEPLGDDDVAGTPVAQFRLWLTHAAAAGIEEPNAMAVATVDEHGQPHVRTILCKEVTDQGFVFFTNYDSDKGRQLDVNPHIGLCFHWQPQHRQVRVTGLAYRIPEPESDAYFQSRPRGAQLGAWASPQSQIIPSRDYLRDQLAGAEQRFTDQVPRPPHWGGYLVVADSVEFWQGQPSRLHDRLRFTARGDSHDLNDPHAWYVQRLAP